jgi:hypothetical protein
VQPYTEFPQAAKSSVIGGFCLIGMYTEPVEA